VARLKVMAQVTGTCLTHVVQHVGIRSCPPSAWLAGSSTAGCMGGFMLNHCLAVVQQVSSAPACFVCCIAAPFAGQIYAHPHACSTPKLLNCRHHVVRLRLLVSMWCCCRDQRLLSGWLMRSWQQVTWRGHVPPCALQWKRGWACMAGETRGHARSAHVCCLHALSVSCGLGQRGLLTCVCLIDVHRQDQVVPVAADAPPLRHPTANLQPGNHISALL
jgi:hypothetical protein